MHPQQNILQHKLKHQNQSQVKQPFMTPGLEMEWAYCQKSKKVNK